MLPSSTSYIRILLATAALGGTASGQDRIHIQPDIQTFEACSLAALEDVDADGFTDLALNDVAGGAVRIVSGFAGKTLYKLPNLGSPVTTGIPLANAGDIDGDGIHDLIVGYDESATQAVVVFSGKTGTLRLAIPLPPELVNTPSAFGFAVAGAGDLNADGRGDLLVGAPLLHLTFGGQSFVASGRVYAYSGATGTELFHVDSPLPSIGFGTALARLGDVDGDAVPDVIVGASRHAFVISGRTGAVLHPVASGMIDGFGLAIAGCDDFDGDSWPDFVVGGTGTPPEFIDGPGFVIAFSGATGAQLWRVDGATPMAGLGTSVRRLPDADGDGIDDVVAGAPGPFFPLGSTGQVLGFSGKDGSTIFTIDAGKDDFRFGFFVEGLRDVNGDGVADVAITSDAGPTKLFIDSTSDLSLVSNRDFISLAHGGSQTLHLQVGGAAAGRRYVVIGSASGVKPGFKYKGHAVPLNIDAYTSLLISNPGVIVGGIGTLDAAGAGNATLVVPPIAQPALAGLVIEHAAVVWAGASGGTVLTVTNASTLRFEP